VTDSPRLGVHLAVAKGLDETLREGKRLKVRAAQIFSKSPRMWAASPLDHERLQAFHEARLKLGIDKLAVHASYLLNLASPVPALRDRSIAGLAEELDRAQAFGAEYLVLHTGSSSSESDRKAVVKRAARAVRLGLKKARAPRVTLLLENAASERGDVGADLFELAELVRQVDAPGRVAVCLDTCHAFQAGYDLRDRKAVDAFAKLVEKTVGAEAVKFFHANDSKQELSGGRDRHEHIDRGYIGGKGFRELLRHPAFRALPFVLETPKDTQTADRRNLELLRELAG
jgi:deoxyribonuclease IV